MNDSKLNYLANLYLSDPGAQARYTFEDFIKVYEWREKQCKNTKSSSTFSAMMMDL